MKRLPVLVFFVVALSSPNLGGNQATTTQATATSVRYGANAAAGHTFTHDGVKLYYEVYGAGEPLLVVHGNGHTYTNYAFLLDHLAANGFVAASIHLQTGVHRSANGPGQSDRWILRCLRLACRSGPRCAAQSG